MIGIEVRGSEVGASGERGSENGASEVRGVEGKGSEVGEIEVCSSTGLEGGGPASMDSEVSGVEEGV